MSRPTAGGETNLAMGQTGSHEPINICLEKTRVTSRWSVRVLLTLTLTVTIAACLASRVAQPSSYHDFADRRAWHGIPNFGDVTSNTAFLVAGIWGLWIVLRKPARVEFIESRERWPYLVLFFALILTACGSAYYHLAPDNARLVWDRLPMTVGFMSLVAAIIMERIDVKWGLYLLPAMLVVGIASVIQWHLTEMAGRGDLRFYAAVQVYAVLVVLLSLVMQPRYTRSYDLAVVGAFYVVAKILETEDRRIYSFGHIVSGHTLKHLAAAAAGFWILRMLLKRKPLLRPERG